VPDYEGSNDYQAAFLQTLHVQWNSGRYISLMGPTLRVNVLADQEWNFGPMLFYRASRSSDVSDDKVEELRRVNSSAELGAFLRYNVDRWSFLIQGGYDVADGHEGFVVTAGAVYTLPVNQSMDASLGATSSYAGDKYMNAYFKIDPDNAARSGLREYSADAGIKDVTFPLVLKYQPQQFRWGLMGVAVYKRLVGDAEDSPVVDDEGDADQFIGGLMVTYRF
jgi:outer membrane protein